MEERDGETLKFDPEVQQIVEAEEQEAQEADKEAQQTPRKLPMEAVLKMLSGAFAKGDISKEQMRQVRSQLGITSSYFTKKKTNAEKAKRNKKIAKKSRVKNRGKGKGQKRNNGHNRSNSR